MLTVKDRPSLGEEAGWAEPMPLSETPELSVAMPCLDEKALLGIARCGLSGEVIVADNGSTDRSIAIALAAGARVVRQPQRGYGHAYQAGFAAARGRYLIMGDSDDTYDFAAIVPFVTLLRSGSYDYVLGSRFKGTILADVMPWHHRYIGNPLLTGLLNRLFGLDSSDAHSGMRAFTREAYARMQLRSPGMEFASEIVVNAAKARLRITEVPITYYPRAGESKLRSFRDGWRHLRSCCSIAPSGSSWCRARSCSSAECSCCWCSPLGVDRSPRIGGRSPRLSWRLLVSCSAGNC